jgi:hypothetical protein
VDWENPRFPGIGALHRRVESVCGPASGLRDLGHQFGDWVGKGRQAPPGTVAVVEKRIAGYLDQARDVGRRWGITVGFWLGVGIGLLILGGVALWAAVIR